ncbi:MAG: rubrerythrin family protein [Planctomycetes bacterium]|nr:rubrerythrin family protein [Planctomycetota bacterium]
MGDSRENLKAAFAGESQANRKYLAYARKAEEDGFPNVAKLFRAAADAETVHALRHWRTLGMIRSTAENLEDAVAGESHEVEDMYPGFIQQAQQDAANSAEISFSGALAAEKVHRDLYGKALEAVRAGKDIGPATYFTCEVCGYTHTGGEAPGKCPVCGAPASKFHKTS